MLISIRLSDDLMKKLRSQAKYLHLTQTEYIRKAIECMNQAMEKKARRTRLMRASLRVRKNSKRINAEFNEIEHDPEI